MVLNVAASLADIVDGPIARLTPGRHPSFAAVGSKLDCYSDIVSHFVVPASLMMHMSDLSVLCTALAALYVCAGILRHVRAIPLCLSRIGSLRTVLDLEHSPRRTKKIPALASTPCNKCAVCNETETLLTFFTVLTAITSLELTVLKR